MKAVKVAFTAQSLTNIRDYRGSFRGAFVCVSVCICTRTGTYAHVCVREVSVLKKSTYIVTSSWKQ
jgi:hypothetical protein